MTSHGNNHHHRYVIQALYTWTLVHTPWDDLAQWIHQTVPLPYQAITATMVESIIHATRITDPWIQAASSQCQIKRIPPIEQSILRLGIWELQHSPQISVKTIVRQCTHLSDHYGSYRNPAQIRMILERLAQRIRSDQPTPSLSLEASHV